MSGNRIILRQANRSLTVAARKRSRDRKGAVVALCFLLLAAPATAAIEGVVLNGTTGREQAGVEVTLLKLDQGMVPVATARSDSYGKFRFGESVAGTGGQPAPVLLRAEFDGVTYNQMIPPGSRTGDVKLTVYRSAPAQGKAGAPQTHIALLEPSGGQMIVVEYFLYSNRAQPPVTYADARQGTLRFYLPPAAKGVVKASATGPGGMPLHETAEKTDQPDTYKVRFPIKPGESRIELTYLVPYQSPMAFEMRSLYDGLVTRVAAPSGVTLSGEGLEPMPENPQIKASIFSLPPVRSFDLSISGEGKLSREKESSGEGSDGESITIIPAPIHDQLWWILGSVLTILALGFYTLYSAGPAGAPKPAPPPQPRSAERPRGKRKA